MSKKSEIMIKLENLSNKDIIDKSFIDEYLFTTIGSLNNRRVKALDMTPEELYLIYNSVTPTTCKCGKETTFSNFKKGYLKFCSTKCMSNDEDIKVKIFDTSVELGLWVTREDRTDFTNYKESVRKITENNDLTVLTNYEARGNDNESYHLDHQVSIKYGFDNSCPAEIIGSIHNLKFISAAENRVKGSNISMTLDSLFNLYFSKSRVTIDTNIFIDEPNVCDNMLRDGLTPIIPYTVLSELDNLKRNIDLKRAAQMAIKNIYFNIENIAVINVPTQGDTNDEKIIKDAKNSNSIVMTNDIGAKVVALVNDVLLSNFEAEDDIDYTYTGYQQITPKCEVEYQRGFHTEKDIPLAEFELTMGVTLKENEYCIVETIGDKNDIWKNINGHCFRISQKMGPYSGAGIQGVQPLDDVQMCVLDAVFDPVVPLTIVDGKLGTGKTMLSLMAALATVQGESRYMFYDKIMVTASPESVNRSMYTGFKPGTSEDKMSGHLGGFKSNLKFLIDPKKDKTGRKSKKQDEETEKPSDIAWAENFEVIEIDEVQGTSLHNTILLVDEYQKLSRDALKLILSRISENSKVVLMGDTAGQVYGLNRGAEGFKTLYQHLGKSKSMNFIKMENIYRSKLAEFVEEIFVD